MDRVVRDGCGSRDIRIPSPTRQTAAGEDASKAGKTGQRRLGDLNGALKQLRQQLGSKAVMRYVDADELELRQAALLDLTAKAQTLQQQCDAGPQYELPTPANKRILEAQHQEIAVQDEGLDQLTNVIQRQLDIGQVWTEIVKVRLDLAHVSHWSSLPYMIDFWLTENLGPDGRAEYDAGWCVRLAVACGTCCRIGR